MSTIWKTEPPEVSGDYLLVGCPPGEYTREYGLPDLFNSPGSITTIDKRLAFEKVYVQTKFGTPIVFADREEWRKAGGPLPGQTSSAPAPDNRKLIERLGLIRDNLDAINKENISGILRMEELIAGLKP